MKRRRTSECFKGEKCVDETINNEQRNDFIIAITNDVALSRYYEFSRDC